MRPELEKQILSKIKQIVDSREVPYFEIASGKLDIYLGTQRILVIDGTEEDFQDARKLITGISRDYNQRCLVTLSRLSEHLNENNLTLIADTETGAVTFHGKRISNGRDWTFTEIYPNIHWFNWKCGEPNTNRFV